MNDMIRVYVGLDVHKDSISVAVAQASGGPARFVGKIAHDVTKLIKTLKTWTVLHRIVREQLETFREQVHTETGTALPDFVANELEGYLRCGVLAHGFLRLRCDECREDHLVGFGCKGRGFCPSCGARRMTQTAAHLVDEILPDVPIRQWVLSLPIPLRVLLAAQPKLLTPVLDVVQRAITGHLVTEYPALAFASQLVGEIAHPFHAGLFRYQHQLGTEGLHDGAPPNSSAARAQRRLARAGQPGEHDQLVARQIEIDVLQIVRARAANANEVHGETRKWGRAVLYRAGGGGGNLPRVRNAFLRLHRGPRPI
jgi:hypothetical protein